MRRWGRVNVYVCNWKSRDFVADSERFELSMNADDYSVKWPNR